MASGFRLAVVGTILVLGLSAERGVAQQNTALEESVERKTSDALRVVSGGLGDTSLELAADLALVLDEPNKLRIMPIMGGGGLQNLDDLIYLKGVDVGFVRSDVLSFAKQQRGYEDVETKIRYISKLHNEEIYVLAGSSSSSISDLSGKPVNFGRASSGNKATLELVFEALGIAVKPVYIDQTLGLHRVKSGQIAATIIVNGRPNDIIAGIRSEDGLKLLPIEHKGALKDLYLPVSLTNDDYPNLIAPGTTVETLATEVVMAMYNWPQNHVRYDRGSAFVEAFFGKLAELRKSPRHPMWRKVNLAAVMPDWERFEPAKAWLDLYGTTRPGEKALSKLRVDFAAFLKQQAADGKASASVTNEDERFRAFLRSNAHKIQAVIQMHMTSADGVGKFIGTIKASNTDALVAGGKEQALSLQIDLRGLPAGQHAFHVHAKPDCGPAERDGTMVAGLGAGGHLLAEHDGKTYGFHLGDLPDLIVAADGKAAAHVLAPRMTLADLLNRSVMVRATQDDNSDRQACGIID